MQLLISLWKFCLFFCIILCNQHDSLYVTLSLFSGLLALMAFSGFEPCYLVCLEYSSLLITVYSALCFAGVSTTNLSLRRKLEGSIATWQLLQNIVLSNNKKYLLFHALFWFFVLPLDLEVAFLSGPNSGFSYGHLICCLSYSLSWDCKDCQCGRMILRVSIPGIKFRKCLEYTSPLVFLITICT